MSKDLSGLGAACINLITCMLTFQLVPYSKTFEREKTFMDSRFCGYSRKIFPQNLGACMASFGDTSEQKFPSIQYLDHFATVELITLQ